MPSNRLGWSKRNAPERSGGKVAEGDREATRKRARMRKAAKANNVPVVALTTDKAERRFESMKAAAARIVKGRLGRGAHL